MAVPHTGGNWIDALPTEVQQATRERMRTRQFDKGEVIYAEGQMHWALWQVCSGTVRVSNQTLDGKEVLFALFTAGDCFGEITLLDGLPAANTATAADRVELSELPQTEFDELFRCHPAFAQQLVRLLAGRMRHMLNFYAEVSLRPLEQRIASRILYLSGGQEAHSMPIALQFTQQDLASMVGATRQAVSKVLNRWRDREFISLAYGKIVILEPAELAILATG